MSARPDAGPAQGRLAQIDAARAVALLAMAIYHFAFDLQLFGYIAPGTVESGGWRLFAQAIAGSFLFLAGLGLWLGHGQGMRWRSFAKRLAIVAAAALAITIVTRIAVPGAYIRFGILHAIAAASVLGLAFLRLPTPVTVIAAAAFIALPHLFRDVAFNAVPWLGLATDVPPQLDFVPIFPWMGPALLGIAAGRIATQSGLWDRLKARGSSRAARILAVPGRWSLVIYLVHQPILVGLVWAWTQVFR